MVVAVLPLSMDAIVLRKGHISAFSTVLRAVDAQSREGWATTGCGELDGIELTTWHAEDASQPLDEGAF